MALILIGKTASGKDTIREELVKMGMKKSISVTTRPPRKGEQNGVTYYFVSDEEFENMKAAGKFAETTEYKVASDDVWKYGTLISELSKDSVIILNPQGMRHIRIYNEETNPIVFYIKASDETIENRLISRGDDEFERKRRLKADNQDFHLMEMYSDFVIRNDMGASAESIAKAIYDLYTGAVE